MYGPRVDRSTYILNHIAPGQRILDIGCACAPNTIRNWDMGTLLHKKVHDSAKACGAQLVGMDLDGPSLKWLQEKMPGAEFVHGDAQKYLDASGRCFDLIIAGDVIEHLPNPGLFLESCLPLMMPGGRMLITTVNAFGVARIAKTLFYHEAVHPEHTAYFSQKTLKRLCEMSGWKVKKNGFIKSEPRDEFSVNRICCTLLEGITSPIYPHFCEGVFVEVERNA
jgi:2-polyprenyl-3-methyl-5-hydroxy-6-metoxy-1,4-benzoquinol methylase